MVAQLYTAIGALAGTVIGLMAEGNFSLFFFCLSLFLNLEK